MIPLRQYIGMCKQAQVAVRERIKTEQTERERAQETEQVDKLQLQKVRDVRISPRDRA